jgi:exodeoxyribonuclease VIII
MTLVYDMPSDLYREATGLSHSEAKLMRTKTPHHLHMRRLHPSHDLRKQTPQMMLGTALHTLALEPAAFEQRYCTDLDENRNSKAYREFARACANAGLTPLSDDDRERVFAMRDSLMSHPEIAASLTGGRSEVSGWFTDPASGVLCKYRADYVKPIRIERACLLVDVKTTADASLDAFSRSIAAFGYHTQCDWYVNGHALAANLECEGMLFVVVETEFPYACAAYTLDTDSLAQAARLNARVRAAYRDCMASGIWPGYGDAVQEIGLPRWAYTQEKTE